MSEINSIEGGSQMPKESIKEVVEKINNGSGSEDDFNKTTEAVYGEVIESLKKKGSGVGKEIFLSLMGVGVSPAKMSTIEPSIIRKLKEGNFIEEIDEGRYKYIGENSDGDKNKKMIERETERVKNVVDPGEEINNESDGYFKRLGKRHRGELERREESNIARENLEDRY